MGKVAFESGIRHFQNYNGRLRTLLAAISSTTTYTFSCPWQKFQICRKFARSVDFSGTDLTVSEGWTSIKHHEYESERLNVDGVRADAVSKYPTFLQWKSVMNGSRPSELRHDVHSFRSQLMRTQVRTQHSYHAKSLCAQPNGRDSWYHPLKLSTADGPMSIWWNPRRSHMGHSHGHDEQTGDRVLGWGLFSDIFLTFTKGSAGFISGSTAILADAAHSVSDIALSAVTLWTSKAARVPKDKEHPYGHGKYETLGALGVSSILVITGAGIAWHAVEVLQVWFMSNLDTVVDTASTHGHDHGHVHEKGWHQHGIDMEHPYVALSAAIISIGVKERLFWITRREGEKQHSELLKASAWHHRSDAISSIVALLGVGGALLGLPLLDPVAGLFVAGMIVKAGFQTGYMSLQELVDAGVSESVLSPIRDTVLHVEGVEGCHNLRGRRMGSSLHLDAHIEVDPWLSVSAAHKIGETARQEIRRQHPEVAESFVHIDPADGRGCEDSFHNQSSIGDLIANALVNGQAKHDASSGDPISEVSKSALLTSKAMKESNGQSRQQSEVERDVRHVMANFQEKMRVSHVTCHFLQGKVVVEVEVSMNPDTSVRQAMTDASDAENVLLQTVPDISAVRVQLNLTPVSWAGST